MKDVIEKPFILSIQKDNRIDLDKISHLLGRSKPFDIKNIKKYNEKDSDKENFDKIYYLAIIAWWYSESLFEKVKIIFKLFEENNNNLNYVAKLSFTVIDNFIEIISKAVSHNYNISEGDLEFSLLLDDIKEGKYYFKFK